ncbi:MAG TPA: DUF2442 domain-containing protein [Solirubrobacterales bacterium]|nr:DUF2442 domain-containing protein [Solirubrobacterales bacterium]
MNRLAPYIVVNASVVRHGVLELTFADGLSGTVEVLPHMWGAVFEQARTKEGFAEAYVDDETHTVAWPGGADLAPDTLYERVRTGEWPEPAWAI